MNWFDWVLVVLFALGIVTAFYYVDRPKPIGTLQVAVITLILNSLLIWGVVAL